MELKLYLLPFFITFKQRIKHVLCLKEMTKINWNLQLKNEGNMPVTKKGLRIVEAEVDKHDRYCKTKIEIERKNKKEI